MINLIPIILLCMLCVVCEYIFHSVGTYTHATVMRYANTCEKNNGATEYFHHLKLLPRLRTVLRIHSLNSHADSGSVPG